MKSTKIMLAVIATFLVTWMTIAFIACIFCNLSYRDCLTDITMIYCMIFIGWFPAVIVGYDLNELL